MDFPKEYLVMLPNIPPIPTKKYSIFPSSPSN
jgi:hypothetical protein